MKKIHFSLILALIVGIGLFFPQTVVESIAPTNIKDSLSSSQLSFFARLGAGNTLNDTYVRINTGTTVAPNVNTTNLFVGDTVAIGRNSGYGTDLYTIRDIGNTAQFAVGTGLADDNAYAGLPVVATRSAIHTVSFTPKSSITGGAWQFLLKATSRSGENEKDGIPDQDGFDLGGDGKVGIGGTGIGSQVKTADFTCPFGSATGVGTTTVISGSSYHVFTCDLGAGATNPVDVGVSMVIGRSLTSGSQIINPSAATDHSTPGRADTYNFYIRHLDGSDNVVDADTIRGRIAVVESVRVTAVIDPTITFSIGTSGVTAGATICGNVMPSSVSDITSTAVPFGSISLGSFNDRAQHLSCITNANNGYVVQVYENGPLTKIGGTETLADTDCDNSYACTVGDSGHNRWQSDNATSGFGYSIHNINATTVPFEYNTSGTYTGKPFGWGSGNAQTIMSNSSTPTTTESIWLCYRIAAASTQSAGTYENRITYVATATF